MAGRDIHLTPPERTLLAGVTLRNGRLVSADALAARVWGDSSHASSKNRVQVLVSGLRRKLAREAQLLVTEAGGYRLAPDVHCDHSEWTQLR